MSTADPEPDAEPGQGPADPPHAPPPVGRTRWLWVVVLLVLVASVGAGLAVGAEVGLRGASVFPAQATPGIARPTILVVARAATPTTPVVVRPTPPTANTDTPASTVVAAEYVVEEGDTMRGVAEKVYGDADMWQRIYSANRDLIGPDPDALQVGMHLHIPPAS